MLREAPGPYPALTRSFPDLVSDLLALDGELAEHLVRPEELRAYDAELLRALEGAKLTNADLRKVPETAAARRELAELVTRYRAAKRERDLLDFGDQIALSAHAGPHPRGRAASCATSSGWCCSTSTRTPRSPSASCSPALFGGGTGHPVTAVGDPCQAIYGWRGASVANLDDFPEHFAHADGGPAARQSLSENRRSGGRLLDLANGLADAAARHARGRGGAPPRPRRRARRPWCAARCCPPTPRRSTGSPTPSPTSCAPARHPARSPCCAAPRTDFAEIQGALVARDVPVEVVGPLRAAAPARGRRPGGRLRGAPGPRRPTPPWSGC